MDNGDKTPTAGNANPEEQPVNQPPAPIENANQSPQDAPTPSAEPQVVQPAAQAPVNDAAPVQSPGMVVPQQTPQPVSPQPNVGGPTTGLSASQASGSGGKKKLGMAAILAIAAIVLTVGGVGAYFGIIVPNKPENVWSRALVNTQKGYEKLVDYAEEQKETKGATMDGTFKIDSEEFKTDGSIQGSSDGKNATVKADIGYGTGRADVELIAMEAANSTNPDMYLKVSGIKGLGALYGPQFGQMLDGLDGQWISIDHTLLDNMAGSGSSSGAEDITSDDVIDFVRQWGEVNKEYVFTADTDKGVLVMKEYVGKDTLDDRAAYHYIVGINKDNLKEYNKALCDRLADHKVMKAMQSGMTDQQRRDDCYDTKDLDDIDEEDSADVWVDAKTKLIRKLRLTEKDKPENFIELSLNHDGGDTYPFVIYSEQNESGEKTEMTIRITLNTSTDSIDLAMDMKLSGDTPGTVNLALNVKPTDTPAEITKPAGAKPLNEVMGALGLGGGFDTLGLFDLPEAQVQ